MAYLAIAELSHVDADVVPATHPLQLSVTLQTLTRVQQSHTAVTPAVASRQLRLSVSKECLVSSVQCLVSGV